MKGVFFTKIFSIGLMCFAALSLSAQDEYLDSDTLIRVKLAELSVELTQPLSIFGDRMNRTGFGFSGAYLHQLRPNGPVFLGMDAYWNTFYSVSVTFQDAVDGFLEDLRERSRTAIAGTDFVTRYYPFIGPIVEDVYVEGLLGVKYIYTTTSVSIVSTAESLDFDIESAKLSYSYGASVGAQFNIKDYMYFLNMKMSYIKGTSAAFYAIPEGQDNRDLTISDLDYRNAPIDLLRYQLGVTFAF